MAAAAAMPWYTGCMVRREDEDDALALPLSSPEQFTRADRGQLDALKGQVQRTQGKEITEQEAQQRLEALKQNLPGKNDEETKRSARAQRATEEAKPLHAATKTRKQEEQEAVTDAKAQQTPERVIAENERKEEAQKELEQTDQIAQIG